MKKARPSGSERPGPDQGRQQPAGVPSRGGGGAAGGDAKGHLLFVGDAKVSSHRGGAAQ